MEKVYTPRSLENIISWGVQSILDPLEEVVDLESIVYNHWRHPIVKRTQNRRRFDVDNVVICTME
jgi:hypothetical protein